MNHSETNPTAVAARAKRDLPDSRNHESQAERTGRDLTRTVLRAEGFSCPSCVAKVEKGVARLPGVDSVRVHFASSRVEVTHDASVTSVADLVGAVARAGYRSKPAPF